MNENEAMSQMPLNTPGGTPEKSGKGALVGAAIIVTILIAGGIYFFSNRMVAPTAPEDSATTAQNDATSIEADLNTIDISGVDQDIEAMDKESAGL